MKKSIKAILKDKKGMSLVLVLCVILLLLGIGTSILTAASSSIGSQSDQWCYDQLKMHTDSVTKTIMYAMQHENSTNPNNPTSLGGKLVKKIYAIKKAENEKKPPISYPTEFILTLDEELPDTKISAVKLNFTSVSMEIQPAIDEIPAIVDENGNILEEKIPRVHERADIKATMQAEFSIQVKNKKMCTLLTFELTGAYLDDDFDKILFPEMDLMMKDLGKWRMISSEKVDV